MFAEIEALTKLLYFLIKLKKTRQTAQMKRTSKERADQKAQKASKLQQRMYQAPDRAQTNVVNSSEDVSSDSFSPNSAFL